MEQTQQNNNELNAYITRLISKGELNDAVYEKSEYYKLSYEDAKKLVYEEYCALNNVQMPTQKYYAYCNDADLPVKPGMTVTIRKGMLVTRLGETPVAAKRTYKVKVNYVGNGQNQYVNHYGEVVGQVNPTVVWAGTGGIWTSVDINDLVGNS